ncbi:MAG: hypothetical protein ACXQTZ_00935, partial [Candidatus Alkanophagales archaeon]
LLLVRDRRFELRLFRLDGGSKLKMVAGKPLLLTCVRGRSVLRCDDGRACLSISENETAFVPAGVSDLEVKAESGVCEVLCAIPM